MKGNFVWNNDMKSKNEPMRLIRICITNRFNFFQFWRLLKKRSGNDFIFARYMLKNAEKPTVIWLSTENFFRSTVRYSPLKWVIFSTKAALGLQPGLVTFPGFGQHPRQFLSDGRWPELCKNWTLRATFAGCVHRSPNRRWPLLCEYKGEFLVDFVIWAGNSHISLRNCTDHSLVNDIRMHVLHD